MTDDLQSIITLLNNQDITNKKKLHAKKQTFLLKFQLFTLIYHKKGQQNFNQIINKIRIVQYGFAQDIFKDSKDRTFTYIINGLVLVFVQKLDDPTSAPVLYRKMGANQHFGEKVIYNGNLKLHSAKTVSKTYVLQLDLQTFYKTFSGHFRYHQLKQKVQFLKTIWIFKDIVLNQIERILLLSKPYRYTKNTVLFKQEEQPQAVFIVIDGQLTLFKKNKQQVGKYQPFMILTRGQVCGFEEVIAKTVYKSGGAVTSSEAVLLKISSKLFLDVFSDKINNGMISQKTILKQRLIQVKSKRSVNNSLKKLNDTQREMDQKQRKPRHKFRYHTQNNKLQIGDIFDIAKTSISWLNCLKDKKMREFSLKQKVNKQKKQSSVMRLSAITNHSFTNDKQLLLSYMIRKQKQQKRQQDQQQDFQRKTIYGIKQLIVANSSAVKNQKRKLRKSRARNIASMPVLM